MKRKYATIKHASNLQGKRALVRVDFNEEIKDGTLRADFKIKKTIPTVLFLREEGARVVLVSHHSKEGQSLEYVVDYLREQGIPTTFVDNISDTETIDTAHDRGHVVLLENLRFWNGEKNNDTDFAKQLASLGDVYVNDAFSVSHREHASIVLLPTLLPAYAGLLFEEEAEKLSSFCAPESPSLMILGGAKAKNKLSSVPKLLSVFDEIFIGGALANNFFKAQGLNVGKSLLDDDAEVAPLLNDRRVILPQDIVVSGPRGFRECAPDEVSDDERILDVGRGTVRFLHSKIELAKSIVCAGPLGMFDESDFARGTRDVYDAVRASTVPSLAGGGDTARFIFEYELEEGFTFISTAGGALLAFLSEGTLPGIEALKK